MTFGEILNLTNLDETLVTIVMNGKELVSEKQVKSNMDLYDYYFKECTGMSVKHSQDHSTIIFNLTQD